ncbi:MAG: aminodeoxychorismate/anthranilate synthase component II [Legionellales bacterium]|nr:aminodeoxychorismate/anthranilate synthase component II [Legionellales bacterium]
MILLIDNYDSFVYNLGRYIIQLGEEITVVRNDRITLDDIEKLAPAKIIISPGPCAPNQAGISLAVVKHFYQSIPLLGICLGHQTIGQALGGNIIRAKKPMHGKASTIIHNQAGVFAGLPSPLSVGRYHSLIIEKASLPSMLMITAETEEGEIMAIEHKHFPVVGLQFHPESVNTELGYEILGNFLAYIGKR